MASSAAQIQRHDIVDQNFLDFVAGFDAPVIPWGELTGGRSGLHRDVFGAMFESQMFSRQFDLVARRLRAQDKVFYTIGSAGHEGNVALGRLTRTTDPAFLHYRSGALVLERARQIPAVDIVRDIGRSFAASIYDAASGGRHKVWGSKVLGVIPQTSTIASQLPKAVGAALSIGRADPWLELPDDAIAICSFGDASFNHSTAQGAFNMVRWTAHQGLALPLLLVCEDNGFGISVRTPRGWIETARELSDWSYRYVDATNLLESWDVIKAAVLQVRDERRPVFLHLRCSRLLGHAGTDFETGYRSLAEVEESERGDPLLNSAASALAGGLWTAEPLLERYREIGELCEQAIDDAAKEPRLSQRSEVMGPLAPLDRDGLASRARRPIESESRNRIWRNGLPEILEPAHMAVQINRALADILAEHPQAVVFGEDVAQKGGVYTLTRDLRRLFGPRRVFNTLLDEQSILGLAQGFGLLGGLPIPEIQYLAYFHNACDQIRGEACSLQFFSAGQFANPMVVRIAGLGYQRGFGGHFHNDNSIAALRDIPGLIVACPARADDAVILLRTLIDLALTSGRVGVFLEPIALYMRKDLHTEGDRQWCFPYPEPPTAAEYGTPRVYEGDPRLTLVTFGNGVPMCLQAIEGFSRRPRIVDLRWLVPLCKEKLLPLIDEADALLCVDEGRRSGGIGEAVLALLAEQGFAGPAACVVGADSYTPLGPAASLVLPTVEEIRTNALELLARLR